MTCSEAQDFLDDYLDGTLPSATRDRFEVHLKTCFECQRYLERYRRSIELGQKLLSEQPDQPATEAVPTDLVDAILDSID